MQTYTLGLMFSMDHKKLLLIEKQRPRWQAGLLNGIGGKIEPGETPIEGMVREFREETGVHTEPEQWEPVALIQGADFKVYCFRALDDALFAATSLTDERVVLVDVNLEDLRGRTLSNVPGLISHALDPDAPFMVLHYRELAVLEKSRAYLP